MIPFRKANFLHLPTAACLAAAVAAWAAGCRLGGQVPPPAPARAQNAAQQPGPRPGEGAASPGPQEPGGTPARLAELLKSQNPNVRVQAVRSIAAEKPPNSAALLSLAIQDPDVTVQVEAVAAMEKLAMRDLLEDALLQPRWRVRRAAVGALGRLKSPAALPALLQVADDQSYGLRAAAAKAIGEIGNPAGAEALVRLLADPAVTVRQAAQESFGKLSGDKMEDFNPAEPAWKNEVALARARSWAAQHAAKTPGPQPVVDAEVEKLLDALAAPQGEARARAVAALVARKEAAVPALEWAADQRAAPVAAAILEEVLPAVDPLYAELKNLGEQDGPRRRLATLRFARLAKGRALPQAALARVRARLAGETDLVVRRLLAERLEEAKDPGLADVLIEGLKLENPQVRAESAQTLGRLKCKKASPQLVQALRDGQPEVQYAAARALGEIGPGAPGAVAPLEKCLLAREVAGRLAFGAALARLGAQSGRDELVRLLTDRTINVAVEVAEAMAAAPHESFVPALIERLDPNNLRLTAALDAALRKITGQDFGYRPNDPQAARERALAAWREWFRTAEQVKTPRKNQ